MDLKRRIQTEALNLGFTLFGVTSSSPPQSLPVYLNWLDAGHHGKMAYLATDRAINRRADPSLILPEVKSIIVLGLRYPRPVDHPSVDSDQLTGRVAAYAWGRDYHDILPPRLEQLSSFLQQESEDQAISRVYTDTGPILERDLACRAGLGWIGKNSCLINPRQGSYFLLAEILTSVALEPDEPFTNDHCGSCRRCIEACPTQCILPNRTIDAQRCISYLTIENKAGIPHEDRSGLGNWIFGCDVCQQVCPWNLRFSGESFAEELDPMPDIARPNLTAELSLNPQEFNRRFKTNPIQRPRRRGYLRNVAVALGNSGSTKAVPPLVNCLQHDPEPMIRAHSAWALGEIHSPEAKSALLNAARIEIIPEVREEIQAALEKFH